MDIFLYGKLKVPHSILGAKNTKFNLLTPKAYSVALSSPMYGAEGDFMKSADQWHNVSNIR